MKRPWLEANGNTFPYRKLIHVASLKARIGWQSLRTDEFVDEGPYCVTGTDFQNGKVNWSTAYHVSVERYEMDRNIQLAKDDLLVTKDGTIGKVAVIEELNAPATLNSGVFVVRPKINGLATNFLGWVIRSKVFDDFVAFNFSGSTINHLYQNVFETFRFPFPDLATQRRIADFLDRETARIDLLIEKKQRLVALLGEKLDRTVRAYLSGEANYPNEDQRCETGIGYLPSAPKHWSVEKVGWRYEIQLGKMLDSAKQTGEHLRRYLRVADVQWGKINSDDLPEMDFSPSDRKRFRLQRGDLLVNEGGSYVGRSAVWRSDEQEVYYQKALHRVRPRRVERDSAEFLYYLMWFATKYGVFVAGGNQTTIDHLTAEAFSRYRFAFPMLDEQIQISERLKFEEARHDEVSTKINASINRLKEYRSALITAAVTGQIDVDNYTRSGTSDRHLHAIQEDMSI